MKEYVIVFARKPTSDLEVLLVLKDKPEWQKGKLNLLGGKIEPGEIPEEAAKRELMEESGLDCLSYPILCGRIVGKDWTVYCCVTDVIDTQQLTPRPEETEVVAWYHWPTIFGDSRLIPNLKIIIPLLRMGSTGWTLSGHEFTQREEYLGDKNSYKIELEEFTLSNYENAIRSQK
jgi:8-oxo-dGTP pyrophosphatase MutT (NUDIX family)